MFGQRGLLNRRATRATKRRSKLPWPDVPRRYGRPAGLCGRDELVSKVGPPKQVLRTPEEFSAALKARGLPTLERLFGLHYHKKPDTRDIYPMRLTKLSNLPRPGNPHPVHPPSRRL